MRDLSVPQAKPAASGKGAKSPQAPPEDLDGEVITAKEIAASNATGPAKVDAKPAGDEIDDDEPSLPVPLRGRLVNPRRKLAVASAPAIGNYQLPPMSSCNRPTSPFSPPNRRRN